VPERARDAAALVERARWVRRETLRIHRDAPEVRLASALSPVEVLVALFYGGLLRLDPRDPAGEGRDRFIVSKGHGVTSLYPILADLGWFDRAELGRVCREGALLKGIPDSTIPGFETINGSMGQGLNVACGMALGLRRRGAGQRVVVLHGDGELYEGSVWEAVMFAGHHRLSDLVVVLDNNRACMLGHCRTIIDLEPLEEKFRAFGWDARRVDGHDVAAVHGALAAVLDGPRRAPTLVVADTVKGKGVPRLERDPLSHIRVVGREELDALIEELA
jgi:transketolase